MKPSQPDIRKAFKKTTVLRSRELSQAGFNRMQIREALKAGKIERAGRGLYLLPSAEITEHHTLATVSKKVPHGVHCLLTALQYHGITTQSPHEVWLAIGPKDWRPRLDHVKLNVVRFSGPALREGVETHVIEGVPVKIYVPAKTVADCFKYRKKIGLDVALEALREAWRSRRVTMDELGRYARVARVEHVMRPYLESLS